MFFQAQLEQRNLAGLVVAQQPVVGVAAIVSVEHDADVIVDRVAVLQSFARAIKFRRAGRIERSESGNGRLGNHDAGRVDAKIIVTRDHAG